MRRPGPSLQNLTKDVILAHSEQELYFFGNRHFYPSSNNMSRKIVPYSERARALFYYQN